MNQIIEVKIKKLKVNFVATCDMFPTCKGIGKTKQDALQKLSKSISQLISGMVNNTFNKVFESDNYTQILMDQSKDPYEEVIGYNFDAKKPMVPKNMLFKVPSILQESDYDDYLEEDDIDDNDLYSQQTILTTGQKHDENINEADIFDQLASFHPKSNHDSESIVFGFPLNFN